MAFEDERWETIDWKPINWERCIERGTLMDISNAAREQGVKVTLAITMRVWHRCLEVREVNHVEHLDTEATEHEQLRMRTLINSLKPNLRRDRKKSFSIMLEFLFPETCDWKMSLLQCRFGRDTNGKRVAVVGYLSHPI